MAPRNDENTAVSSTNATSAARTSKLAQVSDALREQILSGALPPAALLPSELEIATRFGVSRNTAQKALAALKGEGLITIHKGRGSFVRRRSDQPAHTYKRAITHHPDHDPADGPGEGAGFADSDVDSPEWRLVEEAATYHMEATAGLALDMAVPRYTQLFVCDRLLVNDADQRVGHRLYVPFSVAAHVRPLEENPFRMPGELYDILSAADYQLNWREYVRAVMPTPDDGKALHIPASTPMLITVRVTYDGMSGQTLALEQTRRSADDAQLMYWLSASPGAGD
ncbi:GntR family transcriptional regulator [Fodinicola acaciae]|uniref:GntR family transcriptional regulator n=1 Tax=Fodinicola acaciae TaxID=2681555 RepID=UPI0013D20709|nr:GntR family transcriptional regulator [Fodinicola acaciae]